MTNEQLSTERKMLRLVERLRDKTVAGQVKWEPTSSENMFQLALPSYVVRLGAQRSGYNGEDTDYLVSISDGTGRMIESATDADINRAASSSVNAFMLMRELFERARRQALGVDQALDSLLSELE